MANSASSWLLELYLQHVVITHAVAQKDLGAEIDRGPLGAPPAMFTSNGENFNDSDRS